jgi:GNAT superfamily N-acetyltransferase
MTSVEAEGSSAEVTLREPRPEDAEECARIVFEAFGDIHDYHRFERDFPVLEAASALIDGWIAHPQVWGVVAEADGKIVGSNFLDERDEIAGVGPITIDPSGQNAGVGRKLMEAVLERGSRAPGIRLQQDAFHMRSLALYTSLGFRVNAGCVLMTGEPAEEPRADVEVRSLGENDLEECARLCKRVHGFARTGALRDAVEHLRPFAAVRDDRIVAYASALNFWPLAYGVAEAEGDMEALLIGGAAELGEEIRLLIPLQSELFSWTLASGLRLIKPMNLMSIGEYQEPRGAWFPSVLY